MKRRDNLTYRQTDRQTGRQTNYVIDCFRILAVLMVLTVHVRGYLEGIPMIISKLFSIGAYGVALYFKLLFCKWVVSDKLLQAVL